MAASTRKSVNETKPEVAENVSVPAQESTYTAAELAKAHKTFGTSYAIVAAALRIAKKETATIKEAKAIVEKFKNQEVK